MPLRVLFLDMNSYFASVEQQFRPELRGRPVVVAAVDVDSTSCIAASYEAKKLGIRTGTPVGEARRCKDIHVVEARPELYVRVHHQICKAVDTCIPVHGVHSIDELSCRLDSRQMDPAAAMALAHRVKSTIYRQVGEYLKCSIGLAPNRLLAKVAADMQKPDGLTVIREQDLPRTLYPLQLVDLPGVGRRMLPRLAGAGITTIRELYQKSELQLQQVWGGVVGRRWWHWLRGYDLPEPPTRRATIGHSHVLPPELRTMQGAHDVLIHLIHKVAVRLRRMNYWAKWMDAYVSFSFREEGWSGSVALGQCQDTLTMIEAFEDLWSHPPPGGRPTQVAVTLHQLVPPASASLPLFSNQERRIALARTMDRLNEKFGPATLHFAGMHGMEKTAPTRIAFSQIPDITDDDFNLFGSP